MERRTVDDTAFGTSGVETGATTSRPVDDDVENPAVRLVLAGIGAVATVCDTADETFNRLVSRGERVQDEWQDKADELRRQNAGTRYRVRDAFRTAMDVFLDGLNVPNKGDVDTINTKLNILTRKIDDLQMEQVHEEVAPGNAVPPPDLTTGDLAT